MRAVDHVAALRRLPLLLAAAIVLSVVAAGARAQDKCSATGLLGGEKFTANNCTASIRTGASGAEESSVAVWFSDTPIAADEAAGFQQYASVEDSKDGKQRTLVVIMFCTGGANKVSASAVKSVDLHTNHAKSPFLGVQTVLEPSSGLKFEKLSGEARLGGALAGQLTGNFGHTKIDLDFNVKLPTKSASAGLDCE